MALSILLLNAVGCGSGPGVETESSLVYGMKGVDSTIRVFDHTDPWTLGIAMANRGADEIVVADFRIMEAEGVAVTPELLITQPRLIGQIGDADEFPPARAPEYWTSESERPFGEITLPPSDWGGPGDVLVLMRAQVDKDATYAYVKGYEVTGTEGGRPFRDVVDTFTTFCREGTRTGTTPACDAFAAEHGY